MFGYSILGMGAHKQVEQNSLLNDLVSWWTLDETSGTRSDSHGGNDLTDNDTCGYVAAKQSNGVDVNGTSEFLSKSSPSGMNTGNNDWCIAGWVNTDNAATSFGRICALTDSLVDATSDEAWSLQMRGTDSRFSLNIRVSTTIHYVNADTFGVPSAGTWYFIYAYHDASENELGISVNDGTVDTNTYTGTPNSQSGGFTIGRWGITGPYPNWYDGKVDELAFWNRTLTAAEITALYNSGSGIAYSDLSL